MLRLPIEALPTADSDRHAMLREYFCDKDATATRTAEGWHLTLDWPGDLARHVDPNLLDGLAWWNEGVRPETMALAQRRSGRILTALYDTWTLHSWSDWLHRGGNADDVIVLHVDDHRDIAPPRLIAEAECFKDAITSAPVDLAQPDLVRAAIESGAIGMGSFLTPFLHAAPRTEVRHLCQPPKAQSTQDFRIELKMEIDRFLKPGAKRPAVDLHEAVGVGPGTYRLTPSLDDWLVGASKPALVHIDMDYFCNRYDGDSLWRDRAESLNPPLSDILAKIDELSDALGKYARAAPIEDIVIAYSPGFFPAEFWPTADARLRAALESLDGA
ncbi:MAG: hypothetical protein R3C30_05080 [Hyphomonadaceae bacterium]